MRWPWSRKPTERSEGAQARERAERGLDKAIADRRATEAETPMFVALADALRELREANHFAESIRESMRPR